MLSDKFIKNAKPGVYTDEGGLYLQVYPSGKRSFLWRRMVNGKALKEVIGQYPVMSLVEAREHIERRKSGCDFVTVAEAYKQYYAHLEKEFVRPEQVDRMFRKEVLPSLSTEKLSNIQKTTWVGIVQKIVKRGSPVMANRVLTQLKKFLDYAEQHGWLEDNPLEKVKRTTIGDKEKAKDRNLSLDEITVLLDAIPTWGVSDGTRWLLLGCLLTGLRISEVMNIQPDGKAFTKMQRWHQIPMTRLVRFWLSKKPELIPNDHRVLSHALRREKQTFTPHDLRRTYASRLADLGVAPHVIEKLLDHRMVGVMAVYNRADYWPERLAAQRLWDKELIKRRPGS